MNLVESIKNGTCYNTKTVEIGNYGSITIRELFAYEVDELSKLETKLKDKNDTFNEIDYFTEMVLLTVVNGDGLPCFTRDDLDSIKRIPIPVFEQLSDEVLKLSGLAGDTEKN